MKQFGEVLQNNQVFGTRVEGAQVVVTLGNGTCRLDHATAAKLAVFLHHAAREARQNAGVPSYIIGFADLTDANMDEMKAQRRRDGSVFSGRT